MIDLSPTQFLRQIATKIRTIREVEGLYLPKTAPNFNYLGLMQPSGMDLSRIFAELLSSEGNHAQGRIFLDAFLAEFEISAPWSSASKVDVQVEVCTHTNRRIDILLAFYDRNNQAIGAIGIENKPWAADQHQQVIDYIDYLRLRFKDNFVLIYLSGKGYSPSKYSFPEGHHSVNKDVFRIIGYSELRPWLKSCAACAQPHKIKSAIEDIEDFIGINFSGKKQMIEREMIIAEAMRNQSDLAAAINIASAVGDIKATLLAKLFTDLRGLIHQSALFLNSESTCNIDRAEYSLYKKFQLHINSGDKYGITFSFDDNHCNRSVFGICRRDNGPLVVPETHEKINSFLGGGMTEKNHWAWWKNLEPFHWSNDPQVWLDINSGGMAQRFFAEIEQIFSTLKQADGLDLLR